MEKATSINTPTLDYITPLMRITMAARNTLVFGVFSVPLTLTVPVIVLLLLLQKRFTQSIAMTGLKG